MRSTLPACLLSAVVWLLLAARVRYRSLSNSQRRLFHVAVIGVVALGSAALAAIATRNSIHPPEWDMLIFWINGVAASHGQSFYDATLAAHLAGPFQPTPDFYAEALRAPFLYPPPSIFWFVPLGWFSLKAATLLWSVAQLLFLAASVLILGDLFFEERRPARMLFTAALALLLYGVYLNMQTEQTVFLLLLFVCLAFRDRFNYRSGIWLALAILVKPFAAVLLLSFLCLRRWSALFATAASLAVATLASFLIFGRTVFLSYFTIDFAALPMAMYTELENQSLLAWILRLTHATTRFSWAYLVFAAMLTALVLWRLITLPQPREASAFALSLTLALLVYPASLRSYAVLLILPVLLLCSHGVRAAIAVAYGLLFAFSGAITILATLTIGIALAVRMPAIAVHRPTKLSFP